MHVDRFEALADPTRRAVLAALVRAGPEGRTAGVLAHELARGRSLVSYHLARLVAAGLALVEPDAADRRHRVYRAARGGNRPDRARASGTPVPPAPGASHPILRPFTLSADQAIGALTAAVDSPDRRQPLLGGGLPDAARARLAPFLQRRRVYAGEILYTEGEEAGGLWFVESGAVRLYAADADGREQTLQIVPAGASFNEVPFFDLGPEPATAQVVEDGVLLHLAVERRDQVLRAVPELAIAAAASFAFRLRQTIALVEDLSFRQVGGRVARVLLQAVAPHPGVGAGSEGRTLTQQEIAEMVGSSREVVARSLRQLEREGLIRLEHGRIVLLDRAGLAARE